MVYERGRCSTKQGPESIIMLQEETTKDEKDEAVAQK